MAVQISRRACLLGAAAASQLGAADRKAMFDAFGQYVADVEKRFAKLNGSAKEFLWTAGAPDRVTRTKAGEILTEDVETPDVPSGLAQHWRGASFYPGATLAKLRRVDLDVNRYKDMYAPDIIASRLLESTPERIDIYYRLKKKKVLTAVMDTKHRVYFQSLSPTRQTILSRSTEVREVNNHGKPNEKVLPVGEGQGLLYVMNSYWRYEEVADGAFVECEAVTLARSLPLGLRTVIGPLIDSFAVESMKHSLEAKRRAVASLPAA
jgi:hypothetical protein